MRNWFIVAAAAALVAGCAGSGGSTSELAYEGDEAGTERETMRCAGDARLWGDIDVGSGMVTVVVRDERNETVFVRTFTGPGSLDEPRIEVEGETVTVEVHRYKMAEDATDGAANGTLPAGADWQQRPDRFTANQTNSPLGGGPQVDDSPQGRRQAGCWSGWR